MKNADFLITLKDLHVRLLELSASKGEEYKGAEDNQFGNFERGAADTGCTPEQVLWVYLSKHLDSIKTWMRDEAEGRARQRSEPIIGRIDDAILYLALLRGMSIKKANDAELLAIQIEKDRLAFCGPDPHNAARDAMQADADAAKEPIFVVVCGDVTNLAHPRAPVGYGPLFVDRVAGVRDIPDHADIYVVGRPPLASRNSAAYDRSLAAEVRARSYGKLDWRVTYSGSVADLGE